MGLYRHFLRCDFCKQEFEVRHAPSTFHSNWAAIRVAPNDSERLEDPEDSCDDYDMCPDCWKQIFEAKLQRETPK
jgi:hypothetical protein